MCIRNKKEGIFGEKGVWLLVENVFDEDQAACGGQGTGRGAGEGPGEVIRREGLE